MKNKLVSVMLSLALCVGVLGSAAVLSGCGDERGETSNKYNIIMTNSTNPPTLSALKSIKSGDETYAYIQRGNTYYGIDDVKSFHNIGFNRDKQTNELTQSTVSKVSDTIEQIATKRKDAKFTIYVTDYNAYCGYAAAYMAGLEDADFNVVMVEDGSGTYTKFKDKFVTGLDVAGSDTAFEGVITDVADKIDALKTDPTTIGATVPLQDYFAPFGLATIDNGSMHFVSPNTLKSSLETGSLTDSKVYKAFGFSSESSDIKAKYSEGTSANLIEQLTPAQKDQYLKLIGGEAIVETLKRTQLKDGTPVSQNKLVIVGSRFNGNTMSMVDDITNAEEIVEYSSIASSSTMKGIVDLLFAEDDYTQVYEILTDTTNAFTDAQKVAAFNLFAENKFLFKIMSDAAGSDRDLIYKGHPSELVTDSDSWDASRYSVNGVSYKNAIYKLVTNFFENDSLGKTIGVAIGGCDMSNYAFFEGLQYSIGGMSSSTFASYDVNVPVDIIISKGSLNLYTEIPARYEAGNLKDTEGNITTYLNAGAIYQLLGQEDKLATWIASTFKIDSAIAGNYRIDKAGFLGLLNGADIEDISRKVILDYADEKTVNLEKIYKNGDILNLPTPEREGYNFTGWKVNGEDTATKVVFNNNLTADITYTAQWTAISA